MDYHVWGVTMEAYCKLHPTKRRISVDLGQPVTGTNQQGCEKLPTMPEDFVLFCLLGD